MRKCCQAHGDSYAAKTSATGFNTLGVAEESLTSVRAKGAK